MRFINLKKQRIKNMCKRDDYCEIFRNLTICVKHQIISVGFSNCAELCPQYFALQVSRVTHAVRCIFVIHHNLTLMIHGIHHKVYFTPRNPLEKKCLTEVKRALTQCRSCCRSDTVYKIMSAIDSFEIWICSR